MFRALTSLVTVLVATAFTVVAPCGCAVEQAHAAEAPERQEADAADEHDCCDANSDEDEAPAEQDDDDCSCGECDGDCATTSKDEQRVEQTDAGALAPDRSDAFDLEPPSPRLKALVISWLAEREVAFDADDMIADASANSPPKSTTPTYLNLQVLRL